MTSSETEVLIVGAGPTGLVLALWLKRLGVGLRIIDKAPAPGETSRAIAVQARTLEFYRQFGIVDDALAAGIRVERLAMRTPSGTAATLKLGDFGAGLSPYPFAFALPQDIHERILIGHLEKAGVAVERPAELVGFEQDPAGVTATVMKDGASEVIRAAYLCGADGASSTVRHGLKLGFPGGTYEQCFYVADVEAGNAPSGLNVSLDTHGFAIVLPVRQSGSVRLIGVVPDADAASEAIGFETIRAEVERITGVTVSAVNWFSTYRLHHRVAEHFRVARVFLAGDAGHIHSPAGGQGMNTGIGDAVNLGWKLAAVLGGRGDARLLDSYEPERIVFARRLIKSTDQVFRVITSRSALVGLWRRYLLPKMIALFVANRAGARLAFRTVSQIGIAYGDSFLSRGAAGRVRGGDRLPYVEGLADVGEGDNFAPLSSLDWQIHVYGAASPAFRAAIAPTGIPIHAFAWTPGAGEAGLSRDAAYLVRPDGHVAVAVDSQDPAPLLGYIAEFAIKISAATPEAQ
ncbi:FAD-dependent monooxygenase [Sinorhizobium mexicanum]|uniref:Monooxygenase n=1 Tax=Sinorhizobium mexicanum TaxID=375549 RepID=A0A859QDH4_9HYPH|nr:FAD-dependent monooxygenase [Sinorhizobium mexicanum]MBP1887709.1 2-polyprenyl-6-methoxyphenol hydroxylase-like FAD-dependent oxidoreductase [Sinorhizobium mexicanum]QLL62292.1 monooxygenase [Sinorhizobium mexicanum]